MTIRVLIVDDEPLARRGVAVRLRKESDVEVVGMCTNGRQALQRIVELKPDLVFLDIQMPLMSGMEVLRALPSETLPAIIFLTAYDEHALEAFEVHALDYLLKPINDRRFVVAVERARKLIALKQPTALDGSGGAERPKHFPIRNGKNFTLVEVAQIDWVEAEGDYARFHVGEKTYLVRESLNNIEMMLEREDFLRIHRSSLIRLDCIVRAVVSPNKDGHLTLRSGTSLRVGRTYSKSLRAYLNNLRTAEETHDIL